MNREPLITRVARIQATCAPHEWRWASANRDKIQANWQRRKAETPTIFNGRVLLLNDVQVTQELCRSTYFAVDYADFLGWMDMGHPDSSVANGFAMGALRGSDGAFICGVMHGRTANAGRIYFPAGTPDLSDVRPDGSVDLATSLTRELHEETGLSDADYHVDDDWILVQRWPVFALLRMVTLPVPAQEGARRIRAALAEQDKPELSDVRVVCGPEDVDPQAMPLFLQAFFGWQFAQR